MNQSVERSIKDQYAFFFIEEDWIIFKDSADYYFETAAKILGKDIQYGKEEHKLLRRNVTKRLYIGIGCEHLLKAIYLKNGFCINRLRKGKKLQNPYPYKIDDIDKNDFKDDDTLSLNQLIENLFKIEEYGKEKGSIEKGLKISKVFRNKEGHVAVILHDFKAQNYRDIERSLIWIYRKSFNEDLQLTFSVAAGEEANFNIKKIE
ncbi:MAG: hypothetical protein JRJ41_07205 [Deltaproteobacteria bacterium]|nr:hypothetical protein [Deltaproteobacteria bacterium]